MMMSSRITVLFLVTLFVMILQEPATYGLEPKKTELVPPRPDVDKLDPAIRDYLKYLEKQLFVYCVWEDRLEEETKNMKERNG